jgi:hypothetical protein
MWWLVVLILVCIPAVLVGSAFSDSMSQVLPETLPFPSTFNKKPSGYSAMFEVAEKVNLKPKRWQSAYRTLSKDAHGTLIMVLPWEVPSRNDVDNIMKWVAKGNDLIYLDFFTYRSGQKFLEQLNLRSVARTSIKEKVVPVSPGVPESEGLPHLIVSSEAAIVGGTPIIAEDKTGSLLVTVQHGKGRVLIGSVPELCANKYIANPDYRANFQFLANWLASSKQPLLFDEKSHGYSSGSNVFFFVLRSPVGFVILQLLFIALIAFISLNQRFGKALNVPVSRKISNLEFIEGLASTYRRARARDTAWAMMFHPLKAKLCKTLGVAPDASMTELAVAWSEQSGKNESECRQFLEKAQSALERNSLSDEELNELVAMSDKLTGDTRALQPAHKIMGA